MSKRGWEKPLVTDTPLSDLLTPRQLRMVKMAFTGASNQQIAFLMGLSSKTVGNEFFAMYKATGAVNKPHLAALVWWELEGKAKGKGGKHVHNDNHI